MYLQKFDWDKIEPNLERKKELFEAKTVLKYAFFGIFENREGINLIGVTLFLQIVFCTLGVNNPAVS